MNARTDRPPILRFLTLFAAMIAAVLGLASLSPPGGPTIEDATADAARQSAGDISVSVAGRTSAGAARVGPASEDAR